MRNNRYVPRSNALSETAIQWRPVPSGDGWAIEKDGRRLLHFSGPNADLYARMAADKRNGCPL